MSNSETRHLTAAESPQRTVPLLLQEPPLQLCGIRHPLYNAKGGARRCSWMHMVAAVVAFSCAGILGSKDAGLGWPLAAGLVFLVTGFSGFTACIYRLTLTLLISMVTCLISASFSIIMILWAAFSISNFMNTYVNNSTMKLILSVHVILGVCGVVELVTDIVHAMKAIRIICCFRDTKSLPTTSPGHQRINDKRPTTTVVIENPNADEKMSVFV